MFKLRTLLCTVKSALSLIHNCKYTRKFCSQANDFKEVLNDSHVQKYFDHIQTYGIDGSFKSEAKFKVDQLILQRKDVLSSLESLVDLEKNSKGEEDVLKMISDEKNDWKSQLADIEFNLLDALAPELPNSNEVILEVNAGVGGKEAMLFANDLQDMYLNYIAFKNWNITYIDSQGGDLGGLRHCTMFVEGRGVMNHLRLESGIHRVQRVPVTEKHGRVHTSTVTVAVLPKPREIDINLKEKDLLIETMKSSGAGGQHVNTTESAVRITHIPTGLTAECQTDRSQIKNREIARQKLCARLYERQMTEQTTSMHKSRKSQVGTSARSDKIRTYNYPQDRITDHRIPKTLHGLSIFLGGSELLDSLINELILFSEKERYNSFVASLSERVTSTS